MFDGQVALWAWDIVVDNCAICRNHIMDLCEPLPLSSSRPGSSADFFFLNPASCALVSAFC